MKIAVIGAGNVGSALSKAAVAAGHSVVVTASSPESAQRAADDAGATAGTDNQSAVHGADLVVLAVPHGRVKDVAAELADSIAGVTVVDATNPLNDSYSDLVISGASGAEDLQSQLPGASVVKAFNTTFASRYVVPTEHGEPLTVFIAGDDAAAKERVAELAESIGFRSLDAGGLRFARSLEEMAFLNITLNARNGWSWQSAWALAGPTS